MKIINQTKNIILAENAILADTLFKRARGLLGKKSFKNREALIIKPCNSIHTFFMCFPIDVLFVDKNNKIIKAISNLKPSRVTAIYFRANFAIELPAGTIQNTLTSLGDCVLI